MKRSVIVLSPPKSGTQSVYRSLDGRTAGVTVFHAHRLDRTSRFLTGADPEPPTIEAAALAKQRVKVLKEHRLLRELLDVRVFKTLVFIRREPRARLMSLLCHAHFELIASHYDHAADRFGDLPALRRALDALLRDRAATDMDYHEEVYAPLGVPPAALEAPFSITPVRPDLEVAALRFERLGEDFARLCAHFGQPGVELLHLNEARDRRQDTPGQMRPADGFERDLYAAFKRDYAIPDELVGG